jgi:hypothetical protein
MGTERDRIYEKAGFADVYGFGVRPVIVIVDFQYSHTDPASPIASQNWCRRSRRRTGSWRRLARRAS